MSVKLPILKFEIISTILIIISGFLLHFAYDYLNNNPIISIFVPINESIWEHLKLLFLPIVISTIIGYFYYDKDINYICSKTKGLIVSLIFTVIFFYTYSGIVGYNISFIDMGSYIISVVLGQFYTYKNIKSYKSCKPNISISILIILALLFIIFTFNPPNLGIFKPPL